MQNISNSANRSTQNGKTVFFLADFGKMQIVFHFCRLLFMKSVRNLPSCISCVMLVLAVPAGSQPAKCRISPIPQIVLHKTARWFSFLLFRRNAKCLSFLQIAIHKKCKTSVSYSISKMQNISDSANYSTQNSKMVFLLAVSAKCKMSLISADC